jgi:hypothetical protein
MRLNEHPPHLDVNANAITGNLGHVNIPIQVSVTNDIVRPHHHENSPVLLYHVHAHGIKHHLPVAKGPRQPDLEVDELSEARRLCQSAHFEAQERRHPCREKVGLAHEHHHYFHRREHVKVCCYRLDLGAWRTHSKAV